MLLCERDQADGNWEDLLKATARLRTPPNPTVFSRLADESLWAKVLNLGGFDVLMTPFEPEEVLRVTFAAWSRWECDFVADALKRRLVPGDPRPSRRLRRKTAGSGRNERYERDHRRRSRTACMNQE